jgi:hypothetical protein
MPELTLDQQVAVLRTFSYRGGPEQVFIASDGASVYAGSDFVGYMNANGRIKIDRYGSAHRGMWIDRKGSLVHG